MSREAEAWQVAVAALQLANRLVDAIQSAVHAAGFTEVRPVHGFAFARLAAGDATTQALADHLGVSKQAAAQLVERMLRDGFLERVPHPTDRRSRLLRLTPHGRRITQIAQKAAAHAVNSWRHELTGEDAQVFEEALLTLTRDRTTIHPTW